MEPAFWDSSSLVPLCVVQQSTPVANMLSRRYEMVVWWAASVEIRSAFTRLIRMGSLTHNGQIQAQIALDGFRSKWSEVLPADEVRANAERFIDRFPLRAADSLQLAAAFVWSSGRPRNRPFISGDLQLLEAAGRLGFAQIRA
jgi:predicted nucleic acid-binding protein